MSRQITGKISQSHFRIQIRIRSQRRCGEPRPRRLTKALQPSSLRVPHGSRPLVPMVIEPEHDVWTTRSNLMVFSVMDRWTEKRTQVNVESVGECGTECDCDDKDSKHDYNKECTNG
jgi:hypothetical protein